jgi:phospho-N-acetylmuramoyl-pentapeptide-transferase
MIETTYFTDQVIKALSLSMVGFILAMIITPLYTRFAYKYGWWKKKRTTAATGEKLSVIAQQSTRKRRVPTMAGMIMVIAVTVVTFLLNLSREQTWLPLAALLGGAVVGIIDDIINIKSDGTGVAGLKVKVKFSMMIGVGLLGALFFYYKLGYNTVHLPYFGDFTLGWLMIPLFILVIVSTSNAVNISDGRDGLAGGLLLISYTAFGIIASLQNNFGIAAFCFTVAGALLAYVWFNIPPARFFMGDVGSFSLGTALGVVAMLTDTIFLLPIIGFVFVVEAGSSLMQILSKKFFGRKIFIAAPIHHHLEAKGWEKTKVTMRLWVLGVFFAYIGILIAVVGGY